jgi:hypothetical protein
VEDSKPFVVFEVDRILERADTASAEGRDRALGDLAPVLNELPASVLRDDLLRRVAGRLELAEGRLASALASRGAGSPARVADGAHAGNGGPARASDRGPRPERLFLALCVALPALGAQTLAAIDLEQMLTSEQLRAAARHLADGRAGSPLTGLPRDDDQFARLIAGLVELAGRIPDPSPDRLEHARLVLDRDRLDRAIIRARGKRTGTARLARERELVREQIRSVGDRLHEID